MYCAPNCRDGSDVTTKRGLDPFSKYSAFAITRRLRLQLSSVRYWELLEDARGLSRLLKFLLSFPQFLLDLADQHGILGDPEHVVHTVAFAPSQDLFTAKSGIPP
jgi:hypothetical protein